MNYSRRQLEALGEPFGDSATRLKPGGRIYGGGGGGGQPSSQTSISELPEWARPYAQKTLAKAEAATEQPYQTYDQNRIAGFSPDQLKAQEQARNMGPASQLGTATGLASAAGLGALGTQYQSGRFQNQFQAPGQYTPGQFSMLEAQAPELRQYQMGGPERVSAPGMYASQMRAAQTDYSPDLQTFQMGPTERVGTQAFTGQNVEQYMSPYMQSVVDKQQREAIRQAGIAGTQRAGQAVQSGAFGGSRAGLLEAEAQRNLATQLGDIQATGSQAAFQNAQQQFNAQQQANLQAQQANQQAGLTAGVQNLAAQLGVQQLGTQTGLQTALANLNNQQQAQVQNQAARMQAAGMNATQALQAALANQQAGLTTGQQNLNALLGVQQLGAGQNLQAQLANQQMFQTAQQAAEQSRQFGAGQGLQAAGLGAQYGQAAEQLGEQSRQFGANLGLQGLQSALQSAGILGNLGQTQYGQQMGINQLLNQYGQQQQALEQQGLSQAYQDFLNQQNYPYKQLGFMSDMIRGLPLGQQTTAQMYQAPGSLLGQLGGIGMGLYGMSRMKEGGLTNSYAEGGVTDERNVESILSKLSDAQLAQAKQAALNAQDQGQLQMIEAEMAERASLRRGLGSIPVDFAAFMPDEQAMANGGIVAFANGDLVEDPMAALSGLTPEGLAADQARIDEIKARKAAQEEEARLKFLKTAAPEVYQRKMADRPQPTAPAKVEPVARTAPRSEEGAKAPPAAPKTPAKSISEAARIVTDVAKTEVPKDDVRELTRSIKAEFDSISRPDAEALSRMVEKAEKRAEDIKARSVGEALMKFGFGMAAQASKPGQARRSGLAGALESAAAASPIFAESIAENEKLQRAAEDNALKLRMEKARYESALETGNKQLAASLAGSISQRNLQQATLQEQIRRNEVSEGLEREKLGVLRSQASRPGSALEMAYAAISQDPKNAGKSPTELMKLAAETVGAASMYRTDTGVGGKLQAALAKIDEQFNFMNFLDPNSKEAKRLSALREERRAEAMRMFGREEGGVASKSTTKPPTGNWQIEPATTGGR